MKLPNAFYANRVTETIDSIVKYVDQARDLAEDIKPSRTVGPKWKKSSVPRRPKLTDVNPPSVVWVPGKDPLGKPLEVNGKALKEVKRFRLIPKSNLSEGKFVAKKKDINVISKTKFEATLSLVSAPVDVYHAWVRDEYGQEDLLLDAFSIKAPATTTTTPGPTTTTTPGPTTTTTAGPTTTTPRPTTTKRSRKLAIKAAP